MTNEHTNYMKMNKWSPNDKLLLEDLSFNFELLDEEMKSRGINVKWFGAVGDGKTDDTMAFQARWQCAICVTSCLSLQVIIESDKLSRTIAAGFMELALMWIVDKWALGSFGIRSTLQQICSLY